MNIYYVYGYYEVDYNNPIYIGKGKEDRLWRHFDFDNLYMINMFHNKLRSMLINNIPILVKKLFENLEEDVALELEILLIKKYGRRDLGTGILFNMTNGGEGISNPSQETRRKISNTHVGRIQTFDHREKVSRVNTGKRKSKEAISRVTKTMTELRSNPIESYNLYTKETLQKYESIMQASRQGFNPDNIRLCLRGKRKSCSGFGWRYT